MRSRAAIVALFLILVLTVAPAHAAPLSVPGSWLQGVTAWLSSLWGDEGGCLDPNGLVSTSAAASGCLDPDGRAVPCSPAPQSVGPEIPASGCLDPDGHVITCSRP